MNEWTSIYCTTVKNELEKAGTQKSAKTQPALFSVPCDLDVWPFDPKVNGFLELMVEHFNVKFGNPSGSGIEMSYGRTDR